ncbi:MAG: outer membrane beta-barrel protein [Bacteroidaceae bacterium]|nr:outer membrane beta-barrel protein [Prevotellaceae bacterium]MDY2850030.1 outer membrane beta-barrel protein [Bacteroidaceae bacterium]
MKKIYLPLVAMIISIAASAQVYVGGQVGLWRNTDANHTNLGIEPEVGYNINDKWAVGTSVGYAYDYYKGVKTNAFEFSPYARYTVAKFGPASFLLDGGIAFSTVKAKKDSFKSDSYNAWQIGVTPVLKVNLAKKFDFIASLGFLGYRDYDDINIPGEDPDLLSDVYGEKGFGFSLSSNDLKFGIIYNF